MYACPALTQHIWPSG